MPEEKMEKEKVFFKEELSTEEETSTVYVQEDDVKVEITEIQGSVSNLTKFMNFFKL